MDYLKIFTDFAQSIEPLDDAERGRLFSAMLTYARESRIPELSGNERFVWPTAKLHIDREAAYLEKKRESASLGGRTRQARASAVKHPQASSSIDAQKDNDKDNDNDKENDKENDKDKEKEKDKKYFFSAGGEDVPLPRGRYANIPLTESQLAQLRAEFPGDFQQRLDRLSEYVAASGKVYQDHLAVLRSWARKDAEEARAASARGRARAAPRKSESDDWMKEYVKRYCKVKEDAS